MTLAVVDSGGANIHSVEHALRRLGAEPVFTADPATIERADRVVLPGVGSAGAAMTRLAENGLDRLLPRLRQPVLGICLGLQLLFRHSAEGDVALLGVIDAEVARLPEMDGLRVPHMGWNSIHLERDDALLAGMEGSWFYFVHTYAAPVGEWTLASSRHGDAFSAVVRQENFFGVQFHPERSARDGARLLRRFMDMTG